MTHHTDTDTLVLTDQDADLESFANAHGTIIVAFDAEAARVFNENGCCNIRQLSDYGLVGFASYEQMYELYRESAHLRFCTDVLDVSADEALAANVMEQKSIQVLAPILYVRDVVLRIVACENPKTVHVAIVDPWLKGVVEKFALPQVVRAGERP